MATYNLVFMKKYEWTRKILRKYQCLFSFLKPKNPDVQQKAREEIQECISDREATLEDMNNLTYLNNILKETLRLYPIVAHLPRAVSQGASIPEGPSLKKGTEITTFIPALHFSEENFPDPKRFNPDRYDDKGIFVNIIVLLSI